MVTWQMKSVTIKKSHIFRNDKQLSSKTEEKKTIYDAQRTK